MPLLSKNKHALPKWRNQTGSVQFCLCMNHIPHSSVKPAFHLCTQPNASICCVVLKTNGNCQYYVSTCDAAPVLHENQAEAINLPFNTITKAKCIVGRRLLVNETRDATMSMGQGVIVAKGIFVYLFRCCRLSSFSRVKTDGFFGRYLNDIDRHKNWCLWLSLYHSNCDIGKHRVVIEFWIGNEILGMPPKGINLLDPFLYFISYAVYRLGCQQSCKDGCIPFQVDINVCINEYTMQDIHIGPYMAIWGITIIKNRASPHLMCYWFYNLLFISNRCSNDKSKTHAFHMHTHMLNNQMLNYCIDSKLNVASMVFAVLFCVRYRSIFVCTLNGFHCIQSQDSCKHARFVWISIDVSISWKCRPNKQAQDLCDYKLTNILYKKVIKFHGDRTWPCKNVMLSFRGEIPFINLLRQFSFRQGILS